jgi:hypothetical protein
VILRPPVEPENGTVWTKNQANLTPTKMTLNASRRLDLNFDGRNWENGQDIKMYVKFKWNENEYDGNT